MNRDNKLIFESYLKKTTITEDAMAASFDDMDMGNSSPVDKIINDLKEGKDNLFKGLWNGLKKTKGTKAYEKLASMLNDVVEGIRGDGKAVGLLKRIAQSLGRISEKN